MKKEYFSSIYSNDVKGFLFVYKNTTHFIINKVYTDDEIFILKSLCIFYENNNNCNFAIMKGDNIIYK